MFSLQTQRERERKKSIRVTRVNILVFIEAIGKVYSRASKVNDEASSCCDMFGIAVESDVYSGRDPNHMKSKDAGYLFL